MQKIRTLNIGSDYKNVGYNYVTILKEYFVFPR